MLAGSPAQEVVDIFNALTRMSPGEIEQVARAEWRLRALARARPGDNAIDVALLFALLIGGKPEEAMPLAERLLPRRHSMRREQLETLLFEMAQLGMYGSAAQLLRELDRHQLGNLATHLQAVSLWVAWGLGDIDQLTSTVAAGSGAGWNDWQSFIKQITDLGLISHLSARQRIIEEKVFGKQCLNQLVITPGAVYPFELTHYIYVSETYEQRMTIEDRIHSDLDQYFVRCGLGDIHWNAVNELIAPITAAPPWHRDFFIEAA